MQLMDQPSFFRNVLKIDAASCLALGALMTLAGAQIASLTALPASFVVSAGLLLLPVGLFILVTAAQNRPTAAAVATIVVGNIAWVLASVAVASGVLLNPNTLGVGLILIQAFAVAVLTVFEWRGMQRLAEPGSAVRPAE